MAVIMTQEHETVEKPLKAFEFMQRKTKVDLSSLLSGDFHPTIPMSKEPSNAAIRIYVKDSTTYVLAKAALSFRRANDNNFYFMKLLGNGFEIPE